MEKLTYNVTEAAIVLGISRTLAYQLVKNGTLPSIILGKRVVIPIKKLEEFVASGN